jgi:hypothetical protein
MLFAKDNKGVLINEVQIGDLNYKDELDEDFTLQEVNKLVCEK